MQTDETIKPFVVDAIIERPHLFEVNGNRHYIYPTTLGKSYIIAALIDKLEVSSELLKANLAFETLRLASTKGKEVAYIIAYATCKGKDEVFDVENVDALAKEFEGIDDAEMATLLSIVLSNDQSNKLLEHFGIDKELEWMKKAERIKNRERDNSISFCGKSVWGTMIDFAAERYGWTLDYILWGISLTALQMLFSDYAKTIYLSDEERKRYHRPGDDDEVVDVSTMSVDDFKEILKNMT